MDKNTAVIIIPGILGICGIIIGAIINNFYHKSNIKKEQKVRFENMIGEQIASSLTHIRNIEQKINIMEIYDVENQINDNIKSEELASYPIYPAIMENHDTLLVFLDDISEARKSHADNVDNKTAAYLLIMNHYLMRLLALLKHVDEHDYHIIGAIIYIDFQRWQKDFDKLLINRINKSTVKLYSHTGWKWELAKKKYTKKYWDKSILKIITTQNIKKLPTEIQELFEKLMPVINFEDIK